MKPFDLEAALEGKPVQLRNGRKAHVLADKREFPESWGRDLHCMPLVVVDCKGNVSCRLETGYYSHYRRSEKDIVGMWEDPPRTIAEGCHTFPAPVTDVESLPMGTSYWYINNELEAAHEIWSGELQDKHRLDSGLIFLSKEDVATAITAVKAIRTEYLLTPPKQGI